MEILSDKNIVLRGGGYTLEIFLFTILRFLHRSIDLRLKSVCTKFQVDLSKIDGDMAIFAKESVIRIGISRTDKKAKKETKGGQISGGSDKNML